MLEQYSIVSHVKSNFLSSWKITSREISPGHCLVSSTCLLVTKLWDWGSNFFFSNSRQQEYFLYKWAWLGMEVRNCIYLLIVLCISMVSLPDLLAVFSWVWTVEFYLYECLSSSVTSRTYNLLNWFSKIGKKKVLLVQAIHCYVTLA